MYDNTGMDMDIVFTYLLKALVAGKNGPVQTFACLKNKIFTNSSLSIAKESASLTFWFLNLSFRRLKPK